MDTASPETLDQLRAETQGLRTQITAWETHAVTAPPIWFDRVRAAIVVADATWHIQDWNQAAAQRYGWSRAEVIGRSIREIITATRYVAPTRDLYHLPHLQKTPHWSAVFL